jgi:NADPH:quinone reductase-like Zn-dependent oxidoreductase
MVTLTGPSPAQKFGVRALRYTVKANGIELAEIAELVVAGKVKPHIQKTYPLAAASEHLRAVGRAHRGQNAPVSN